MARGKTRGKFRRSSLYTFGCLHNPNASELNEPHQLEGPGYSRIVYCNDPDHHKKKPLKYCSNKISTTKYNMLTFIPKAIFEQFRRVANVYFLVAAFVSVTRLSPFSPVSMIAPLAFVMGISMVKEAIEDSKRYIQDLKVNTRKSSIHKRGGEFSPKPWAEICVGDVVKVEKDEFFPADLLLLSSNYDDGTCFVETMNLDGETNLKGKRALEVTLPFSEDEIFKNFNGKIRCEDPNASLYDFVGNLECNHQLYPLNPKQILLRDSKLRNTAYVYGVVIFTGVDCKVMQNSELPPSKRSRVERKMDKIVYILFALLILTSLISSTGFAVRAQFNMPQWWYLQPFAKVEYSKPFDKLDSDDPEHPVKSGFAHLVTALILYGYLIPISLYVSIEVVKFLQAMFINNDIHMYDEDMGIHARARTSNLNEELGQVDTILSDKTGTLTCNQMDFLKCSIAGIAYGTRVSEVELASERKLARELSRQETDLISSFGRHNNNSEIELESVVMGKYGKNERPRIKGFGFEDSRLMDGNWTREPNADVILLFFRILAMCHTAIPEVNEETGGITYDAESPDEGAFLVAAREFGVEFWKRTPSSIFVREKYSLFQEPIIREYKILETLDFSSERKRMSVIIQDMDGQILLLCKGADSIIFDRLANNGKMYEEATTSHLNGYGDSGLRTLALAYKKLEEEEFWAWKSEFLEVRNSMGGERERMLEELSDSIERDLILIGATAVEDKLQKGVPECIDKLAQAGLKIWVLTGDKMQTAINIGFACSLLRQDMTQICIRSTNLDGLINDSKAAVKENISMQIANASQMIKLDNDPHAAFALIIEGDTLSYILGNDLKHSFLNLAVDCASVICCRVSPKQKSQVTKLVKEGTGRVTLAIGDGANDVGMIQEADIGVGISGVEGMQAVMASDFAIAQFRFLERLLVVHGHWCYKRIAQMICYSFYKNVAFGLTLFYFEAFTGFSGQSVYDDWFMTLFNVILTSLPVISLGVFEQDVSSDICLQFPALYQQGARNLFFDWSRIFGWLANGLYSSIVIFFFNLLIYCNQAFRKGGQTSDMADVGATMFTSIIWAVNVQIALTISHFTWIQHLFIWGSIATWYIFLFLYGMVSPIYSKYSFHVFQEALAPAPIFWATTLLVTITCVMPYLAYLLYQRCFNPMDHHIIQEIKYNKKDVADRWMWRRERSKARQKTEIGFSAKVDSKIRQLKEKLVKTYSGLNSTVISPRSLQE